MPQTDLQVPARYYARLLQMLAQDGVDLNPLLRGLRLSQRQLAEPDALVGLPQVDRLIQRVVESGARSDLPFDVGKLLTASSHSFVGFGMLNSASVDQALRFEAQYFRLVMPSFRMRYVGGADFGEMQFTPAVAMSHACLNFHLEAIGLAALREVSDLTGSRRPPCRLDLSIPEPLHLRRYERELGDVRVRFSADARPVVRLRLLDDPRGLRLSMADDNALQVAEARCRALVQQVADGGRFADWIAMTLREVAEGLPSQEELAATLNLSRRTLNRYLAREGTTYRELAGRIQHELACERLGKSGMSPTEVAYSLGFSDLSNFSRAFRARAGYNPGEHRTRQTAAPVRQAPPRARSP